MTRRPSSDRTREALGLFLKSRRAALSPGDFGFALSSRRRTPGLRREEVAVLAGVGTSWYTWLEQGRDIKVSEHVASAIARALRLSVVEQRYFFRLAGLEVIAQPGECSRRVTDPEEFARLVAVFHTNPVLVIDRYWNVLAANQAARLVFRLPSATEYNLLAERFTAPNLERDFPSFGDFAEHTVRRMRLDLAWHLDDPECVSHIEYLCGISPLFHHLWQRHDVGEPAMHREVFVHPEFGMRSFDVRVADLMTGRGEKLLIHLPVAGATTDVLASLPDAAIPAQPWRDTPVAPVPAGAAPRER